MIFVPEFTIQLFYYMKRKPGVTGSDHPEKDHENYDEAHEFIKRKKIQNKVLKEIIEKLQNAPGNEKGKESK